MKKTLVLTITFLFVFCITFCQSTELEVEGAIQIGNTIELNPEAGTIKWTGSDYLGYNGNKWISFTTGVAFDGIVMDIDSNVYTTIKVGAQQWMTENLRTTHYHNPTAAEPKGTLIPNIIEDGDWSNANFGAWSWLDNDSSNDLIYGKLYNFYAVEDNRGLCPSGWRVATDLDWTALTNFLGGTTNAYNKLKEAGTAHWDSPNLGSTNTSGFTGLPGGKRDDTTGGFSDIWGFWWTSTAPDTRHGWGRCLGCSATRVHRDGYPKNDGYAVRCIKI